MKEEKVDETPYISYWNCSRNKSVKIMRNKNNSTPETLETIPFSGEFPTDQEMTWIERRLAAHKKSSK